MADNTMEKRRGYGLLAMGAGAIGWLAYRQSAAGKRAIAADRANEELPMPLAYQQAEDTILPLILISMAGIGVGGGLYALHLANKAEGGSTEGLEEDDLAGPNDDAVAAQVKRVEAAKKKSPDKLVRLFDALLEEARSNGKDFGNTQQGDRPPNRTEMEKYASSWKKGTAMTRLGLYLTTHGVTGLPKRVLMDRLHQIYGRRFSMAFAETYADKARKAGRKEYAQSAEVARVQMAKDWADDCVFFFKEVEKERGIFNK